jgi:hypothetical protein
MDKRCKVANKCFSDFFSLPLCEESASDCYTVAEIRHEVEERIVKLAAINPACMLSVESILKYEIGNLKTPNATAELEPVSTHKYIFRISKAAARKCYEKYLDTIIYHELCHVLQVDSLIAAHILYFDTGELYYDRSQKEIVNLLYEADGGHTKLWYSFVKSANAALVINPPVDRLFDVNLDISDVFLEDTLCRDKVIVHHRVFADDFSQLLEPPKENN